MRPPGMSDRVLDLLSTNAGEAFDVPKIEASLKIPRQNIYQSLHELTKNGEINRVKRKSGHGSWYWYGDEDSEPNIPEEHQGVTTPAVEPAGSPARKKRSKPTAPAPISTGAGVSTSFPVTGTLEATGEPEVSFAISEDGALGISTWSGEKKINVVLPKEVVQRLNRFLSPTAELWRE